jgi:predicted ATPase
MNVVSHRHVRQTLNGRPIESLIDLPLMTDPKPQVVMQVFSALLVAAYFTDSQLWCLQVCRMVNVSIQHGTSGASAYAYANLGLSSDAPFTITASATLFGRLACDLVEKYGFISNQARVYGVMGVVAFWTQPNRDRDRFHAGVLSHRDRDGGSCFCLFRHVRTPHTPSPPE